MRLIDASHIQQWASRIDAAAELPRLVRRLILASVPSEHIQRLDFPAGADTRLPGWDGCLVVDMETLWFPRGASKWELSVRADAVAKASDDACKRLKNTTPQERRGTCYVAVTAHRVQPETRQNWEDARRAEDWADARFIGAAELAQWLERTPAVALWFAKQAGIADGDVRTLEQAWEAWSARSEPTTAPRLLLAGRQAQQEKLVERLAGPIDPICVQAHSPDEAYGFILATLVSAPDEHRERFAANTIVMNARDQTASLAGVTGMLVVQNAQNLDLTTSLQREHRVLVPVGRTNSQVNNPITLERATRYDFAEALQSMGMGEAESEREAHACGRYVSIFHRLHPSSTADPPNWHENAQVLTVLLAGRWDADNANDQEALSKLAGVASYGDLEDAFRDLLLADDSPLLNEASLFTLTAPGDVFQICARRLTSAHLERFAVVATDVFSEIDPRLNLPPDQRPYASLYGATPKHSRFLRDGLAETLLLIAARGSNAEMRGQRICQDWADDLVRKLPGLASDPRVIESLDAQLPMLMEAAPTPFLDALERLLEGQPEALRELLERQSGDFFGGDSRHVELMWGLQTLAWSPELLERVALILAQFAELDPGGNHHPRPLGSLRDALLCWHPQTHAPLDRRLEALDAVLAKYPKAGWKLLLELFPENHSTVLSTGIPRWKDFGTDHARRLTNGEVAKCYRAVVERVLQRLGDDPERWRALLAKVSRQAVLPEHLQELVQQLEVIEQQLLDPDRRRTFSELVGRFVRHHLKLPDGKWVLSKVDLQPIESLAERFAPADPVERHAWLFENSWVDVPAGKDEEPRERADMLRKKAVREIHEIKGMEGVLELATGTDYPDLVLRPLVERLQDPDEIWSAIELICQHEYSDALVAITSAIALQLLGNEWRTTLEDRLHSNNWTEDQKVLLLQYWPLEPSSWLFAGQLGARANSLYWKTCDPYLRSLAGDDLIYAVQHLLKAKRPFNIPSDLDNRMGELPSELWLKVIDTHTDISKEAANDTPPVADIRSLEDVFDHLTGRDDVDANELVQREWAWLPLVVNPRRKCAHQPAIYRLLAQSPELFVELLRGAYRADDEEAEDAPSEERRNRASACHHVLMHWRHLPGTSPENGIDGETLRDWVVRARELSAQAKRRVVGDIWLGRMLAYAPGDPEDEAWPHRMVRDLLEYIGSPDVENNIRSEQHGKRGVYSRGLHEGGAQEHELAARARGWAKTVGHRWPRTRTMLKDIAEMWDDHAARQDEEVRRSKLME